MLCARPLFMLNIAIKVEEMDGMTEKPGALLAAGVFLLMTACATAPAGDNGNGAPAHENWFAAAWHWIFPPEPAPSAPPVPDPVKIPPEEAKKPDILPEEDPMRPRTDPGGQEEDIATRDDVVEEPLPYTDYDFGPGLSGLIGDGSGAGDWYGPDPVIIDGGGGYAPDDLTVDPYVLDMLRSSGASLGDNPSIEDILAAIEAGVLDGLESAAAAGPGFARSECEAELDGINPIRLTCQDRDDYGAPSQLRTASVPVRGTVIDTLNRLAIQLGGGEQKVQTGRPDATLCVWNNDNTLALSGTEYFYECLSFDRPLSEQVAAGAGSFDTGRVAHQAPREMVVDQPYFLEIAIQPLTRDMSQDEADETLRNTLGTGLAPGSTETPFDIQFDTVRASKVMSADLVGSGFDISPVTPKEQVVMADAPTVWQWQVTPKQGGYGYLTYRLSQNLEADGQRFERVVKTIPLNVEVNTIEELLADTPSEPPPAQRGASPMTGAMLAPAQPEAAGGGPSIMALASAGDAGCTWTEGSDPDRFALVLSNLSYNPPISRLSVTHEDGDRIAEALKETGFGVKRCRDLGRADTLSALRDVGRKSYARQESGAHPVTFFYYSGHGVNLDGTNYVLPIDLPGANPYEIADGAVSFEQIFNIVATKVASTAFIVFDACRTVMDDDSRGMLRAYQPVTWSTGVFQAYATEPGKTAADDGAYSQELAVRIPTRGVAANVLFKDVQDAVARRTNQAQNPNYIDMTTGGKFYFRPDPGAAP